MTPYTPSQADIERYTRFVVGHPGMESHPDDTAATRAVLNALAADGRLLPADGYYQWGVQLHLSSRNLLCESEARARELADTRGIPLYRREVRGNWIGQWIPVADGGASS